MSLNTESWQEALRVGVVLSRWRTLISFRGVVYRVRHTLQGKIGLAVTVILVSMLAPYLVLGFLETIPETKAGLDGLLFAAHFWLALTLALMILVQFTKTFLKDRGQEPLNAHPSHFPALNRQRVFATIPPATLVFTGLFFAYFFQLLLVRLDRPWLAIPVLLLTTGLLVVSSATVIGYFGRRLLRLAAERGIRNEDRFINAVGSVAIATFSVLLLGIIIADKHAPGVFETLGNSMAVSVPVGMIPLVTAVAADEGRWLALGGWLGLSGLMALWSVRAIYRWSFSAHREIPIDLATPVKRMFAPAFSGQGGRWLPDGVSAFWRKDIVVPYSREPKRYLFHQVNLIWWGIMAAILAMALRDRGNISAALGDTIPVLMTLLAMAVIAMQNGVNALGREGKELTWLRPIFSGRQLFGRKLLVNIGYVLIHGVAYALIMSTASNAASLQTPAWVLLAYAVGAGAVFACLATAVGFLLPDFERKGSSLPGSTGIGKVGFLFGALLLIAITGTAHLLLAAEIFDGATYAGLVSFASVCAAVSFAVITAGALRQYQGMEI